jgi:putative Flp pilus-assembly TadE/G-like protein
MPKTGSGHGRGTSRLSRRAASDESGQVVVIASLFIVAAIVCIGLVVDVGHAMLVQRQLQAGVDAAALAGAQDLPNVAATQTTAYNFSPTPGSKNAVNTVDNAVTTVNVLCITGVPGCNRRDGGVNGLKVAAQSNVPTWFGRIIGITKMTVNAQATACAPCSVKPLDIMIVLDRTGSMCTPSGPNGSCPDLQNATDGIETFIQLMDPSTDKIGLAVLPPVLNASLVGNCPYKPWDGNSNPNPWPPPGLNGKYYGYDQWWSPDGTTKPGFPSTESTHYVIASMEGADGTPNDDYIINDPQNGWIINPASTFVQRLGCVRAAGSTHYAAALEEAKYELGRNGRGNVQDIIIFLTDGGANTTPQNIPTGDPLAQQPASQPCGAAVAIANQLKPSTIIYTIGYDLDGANPGQNEPCRKPDPVTGHQNNNIGFETGCGLYPNTGWGSVNGCTSWDALHAMATDPDGPSGSTPPYFYNQPQPQDLSNIFTQIALDIQASRGRLIDNDSPNLIGP